MVKLSADGSKLLCGTYLGGSLNEAAWNLAVDASGNATIVGNTFSTNFPTTANAMQYSALTKRCVNILRTRATARRKWSAYSPMLLKVWRTRL